MGQINGLRPVLGLQLDSMILKIFSNLNSSILPAATLINASNARTCLKHSRALLQKSLVYFNPSQ